MFIIMGTWQPQADTQKCTGNIPATPGETTYNSDLYYIGLLKNGKPTTITISDFTITKPDWIKDVSLGNKSPYGDYYPLTYKVDENTDTSERVGHISITHSAANKSIDYQITQSANTTQEPTEPTLNEYVFQITNYKSNKNYSLQVCGHSADPDNNVSFATIKANDINDSTSLNIDIKISLKATIDTTGKNPTFQFIIRGDGFKFDSSINQNDGTTGQKSVDIILGSERKGNLSIGRNTTVSGGLGVHITIFSNNQNPKPVALLSEGISTGVLSDSIEGTITINSHDIRFKVTLGFGALQQ